MQTPTPEESQHMRELLEEFRTIVSNIPKTRTENMEVRERVRSRLATIRSEMKDFLRKYPSSMAEVKDV